MPSEERTTKSGERCDLHPGNPSVATCDGCGRPLCLACAVPVRGRVLGAECLAEALGPYPTLPDAAPPLPRMSRAGALVGAAFATAALATLLPWARFGEGSGPFGAWSRSFRWSMVAALAALLGLALWLLRRALHRGAGRIHAWLAATLAALVTVGAALAILRPPSFTHAWIGPWLELVAGATALASSVTERRALARSGRARI